MLREKQCNCDEEQDGTYKVGDIWHYETGNDVWVKVAVEYFPNSTSERGKSLRSVKRASELRINGSKPNTKLSH